MNTHNALINAINLCLYGKKVLPQPEKVDAKAMYISAKRHSTVNLIYYGMLKSGEYTEEELLPLKKCNQLYTFQYLRQVQELQRLCSALKEQKIRFVVLKGSRMREFYPKPELRSSCDIDILTQASDNEILHLMERLGYQFEKDGGTSLNFTLQPLVSVEMHRYLFDDKMEFHGYFDAIWERVQPSEDGSSECFLAEEDFYLYMVAHLVKHFTRYGCGLRLLLDLYLYEKEIGGRCNFSIAEKTLEELNLLHFVKEIRLLLWHWFEDGVLNAQDERLTEYILQSGVYGTAQTMRANRFRQDSSKKANRLSALMHHVFPPIKTMRPLYPRLLKCPVFLPLSWLARWFRLAFRDKKKAKKQFHSIMAVDKSYVSEVANIMNRLHLR